MLLANASLNVLREIVIASVEFQMLIVQRFKHVLTFQAQVYVFLHHLVLYLHFLSVCVVIQLHVVRKNIVLMIQFLLMVNAFLCVQLWEINAYVALLLNKIVMLQIIANLLQQLLMENVYQNVLMEILIASVELIMCIAVLT